MTLEAAFEPLWVEPLMRVIFGAVLGAIFGSFIGAAVVRLPLGRSPMRGRSCCDACGTRLGPGELVPILSFVLLRGRCRVCGKAIDRWQPAAEVGGAMVGASAALAASGVAGFGGSMALGLQLLLLGLLDARHLWLPDRLVLLLAGTGIVEAWLRFGLGPSLLSESLAGALLGFGMLWLIAAAYRRARGREGMGAGDPKLMGALGLWIGPAGVALTLLAASLGGIALAGAMALGGRRIDAATPLPFGSMLALAGWLVWLIMPRLVG